MQLFTSIQSPQYRLTLIAIACIVVTGLALLQFSNQVISEIERNDQYIESRMEL